MTNKPAIKRKDVFASRLLSAIFAKGSCCHEVALKADITDKKLMKFISTWNQVRPTKAEVLSLAKVLSVDGEWLGGYNIPGSTSLDQLYPETPW